MDFWYRFADRAYNWLTETVEHLWRSYSGRFAASEFASLVEHLIDAVLIIAFAWLVLKVTQRMVNRVIGRLTKLSAPARRRKIETIASLIHSSVKYGVYILAGMWILIKFGVPSDTLTVSVGVIGAAVGFGSQGLIQDIITGLSILAEEQLAVGDYVEISGKSGAVEEVGLRVIKLRDALGVQHVIFNRNIAMVSNFTASHMQAVVDVSLKSLADGEAAQRVARRVAQDIAAETPFFPIAPEIEGVRQSTAGDIFLRLHVRVLPAQQDQINTLFVDRLKHAFAAEKIEIPEGRIRVIMLSDLFRQAIQQSAPPPAPAETANDDKDYDGGV